MKPAQSPLPKLRPEEIKRRTQEIEQQIVANQHRTIAFGSIAVVLAFVIAGLFFRSAPTAPPKKPKKQTLSKEELIYTPRYSLPPKSLWVIAYQQSTAPSLDAVADPNRPLSEKWVQLVAYHLIIGEQSLREQQPQKAVAHLEKALSVFPALQEVHGLLGTVYLQMNQLTPAIRHLQAALQERRALETLNNLGAALIRVNELDAAQPYLLEAHELSPTHPASLKNLALLYRDQEQPDSSVTFFKQYFEQVEQDASTAELYAHYLDELDRPADAIGFLQTYSRRGDGSQALPLYRLLAEFEAQQTNTTAAVEALERMASCTTPNLALAELSSEALNPIRKTAEFEHFVQQLELALITQK